jgi:hypothetical protein
MHHDHDDHGHGGHGHHHHDHDHPHDHGHNHGPGHNRPAAQWQTPHDPAAGEKGAPSMPEPDFDLVETAFVAGFTSAPDPVSFLRLARIPFTGRTAEGETLQLLRVETDEAVDVASITPHLGGASMRYDPLPPRMVSRRRRLGFIYFDGKAARRLSFAEALALKV